MSQGLFSGSISESANRVTPSHRAKADHLKKETPALSAALQLAFQGLAWDVAGEAFLAGDFSRLDTGQRLLIAKLRKSMELDAFALIKGLHPTLVALALIANITEDRLALRFTRRVFQSMPESDWAELKLPGAGKDTRGRI
jgi:hypothetical protein